MPELNFKEPTIGKLGLPKFNAWVVLYLAMALFWCYMAYTELLQKEDEDLLPDAASEKPVIEGSVA